MAQLPTYCVRTNFVCLVSLFLVFHWIGVRPIHEGECGVRPRLENRTLQGCPNGSLLHFVQNCSDVGSILSPFVWFSGVPIGFWRGWCCFPVDWDGKGGLKWDIWLNACFRHLIYVHRLRASLSKWCVCVRKKVCVCVWVCFCLIDWAEDVQLIEILSPNTACNGQ